MVESLFNWLYYTVNSASWIAFIGSFIWGILSIVLSPCHLASIPLVVGFIDKQGLISTKKAFLISTLFSTGILFSIAVIGIITGLLGRIIGDIGSIGNYAVAIIFFLVGLYLIGIIRLPDFWKVNPETIKNHGLLSAFVLGLIFGTALGPCTFAFMAPILGIVFSIANEKLFYSVFLIFVYAAGHCSVIILAGTFSNIVQKYLNWNEKSKGALYLRKTCGVLVILGGIYLLIK